MRFLLEEGKEMTKETVYESHISTARWIVYDVPGNVGHGGLIAERTEQFIEEVKAVHAASMTAKE